MSIIQYRVLDWNSKIEFWHWTKIGNETYLICSKFQKVWFLVFNATFNSISDIVSKNVNWNTARWTLSNNQSINQSINHYTHSIKCKKYTYCCIEIISPWTGFELTTLVVIDTDCTGRCKSKLPYYHDHDGPINLIATIYLKYCWKWR
jgi:hypothetical protein